MKKHDELQERLFKICSQLSEELATVMDDRDALAGAIVFSVVAHWFGKAIVIACMGDPTSIEIGLAEAEHSIRKSTVEGRKDLAKIS